MENLNKEQLWKAMSSDMEEVFVHTITAYNASTTNETQTLIIHYMDQIWIHACDVEATHNVHVVLDAFVYKEFIEILSPETGVCLEIMKHGRFHKYEMMHFSHLMS